VGEQLAEDASVGGVVIDHQHRQAYEVSRRRRDRGTEQAIDAACFASPAWA
jgi:hypothetical protein